MVRKCVPTSASTRQPQSNSRGFISDKRDKSYELSTSELTKGNIPSIHLGTNRHGLCQSPPKKKGKTKDLLRNKFLSKNQKTFLGVMNQQEHLPEGDAAIKVIPSSKMTSLQHAANIIEQSVAPLNTIVGGSANETTSVSSSSSATWIHSRTSNKRSASNREKWRYFLHHTMPLFNRSDRQSIPLPTTAATHPSFTSCLSSPTSSPSSSSISTRNIFLGVNTPDSPSMDICMSNQMDTLSASSPPIPPPLRFVAPPPSPPPPPPPSSSLSQSPQSSDIQHSPSSLRRLPSLSELNLMYHNKQMYSIEQQQQHHHHQHQHHHHHHQEKMKGEQIYQYSSYQHQHCNVCGYHTLPSPPRTALSPSAGSIPSSHPSMMFPSMKLPPLKDILK